jgi:MarR-like DNA-binding transcriptional regulator SgrR of sgrS sRNA
MSYLYSDMVYEVRGLTHIQYRILSHLARYASRDGKNAYPSLTTLAEGAECSERYVRETLRELEDKCLIVARSKIGGRGKPTIYDITLPKELIEKYKRTHAKKILPVVGAEKTKITRSFLDQFGDKDNGIS